MKRLPLLLAALLLAATRMPAQIAVELKQQSLARWNVGTAQYSGIAPLGDDRYAVVSDKEPADGFFLFTIRQDAATGEVTDVVLEGFRGSSASATDAQGHSLRDAEGIARYTPAGTLFISGEGDQRILEYTLAGQPTGRSLAVPAAMSRERIYPNYGFEALTYSDAHGLFWTVTESMLRADGTPAGQLAPGGHNLLRLQSFGHDLQPAAQYAYRMDPPRTVKFGRMHIFGVPALTALPDGSLLVLEREADIRANYLGSSVACKIYRVRPLDSWQIDGSTDLSRLDPNRFLVKEPVAAFTTRLTATSTAFANYEGMCPGRRLQDGRQTLLLISDSQGGAGRGPYRLKDFIKVLILP